MTNLAPILESLRRGKMIILVDDRHRENEGDLVMAAVHVTPKAIAFMARFGRGLICVPMTAERATKLALNPMTNHNTAPLKCNFTVSVDAKLGITTGISAFDRAATIRTLVLTQTRPDDLVQPGHVFPLIAAKDGLRARAGHTEGAVELLMQANMTPIAVICEIIDDDGTMRRGKSLLKFAKKHALPICSIADLTKRRGSKVKNSKLPQKAEILVVKHVCACLPTAYGTFKAVVYTTSVDDKEHVALINGTISKRTPVLVRIHSECLTGDTFMSVRCDCYRQLHYSLMQIGAAHSGILLYMRHEGRGIGLINKLRAYNLQDKGLDTVDANKALGFEADQRDHALAGYILRELGVGEAHLMTNNPDKMKALTAAGIRVSARIPLQLPAQSSSEQSYLLTKKKKMGHLLTHI